MVYGFCLCCDIYPTLYANLVAPAGTSNTEGSSLPEGNAHQLFEMLESVFYERLHGTAAGAESSDPGRHLYLSLQIPYKYVHELWITASCIHLEAVSFRRRIGTYAYSGRNALMVVS